MAIQGSVTKYLFAFITNQEEKLGFLGPNESHCLATPSVVCGTVAGSLLGSLLAIQNLWPRPDLPD